METTIMRMSLVRFRETMADPINRVLYQGERIVLERHGKGVAVVVSMEDWQTLEALEDAADVKAALKARKEGGAVPWEQVKAELGLVGSAQAVKPGEVKKPRRAKA
jgi:PHD/YefM family antitoxin component YafN of YafNO toxin-antitoxin module